MAKVRRASTTEKGDAFEELCHFLILEGINNGTLGLSPEFTRVFRKKGYFSRERNKKIIFDLSIEIWPPMADNYSYVYLVECKDYKKSIPIEKLEVLARRTKSVAELNSKAIFISKTPFIESVNEYAKRTGMMLIEAPEKGKSKIILYKRERRKVLTANSPTEANLEQFFQKVFASKNRSRTLPQVHSKKSLAILARELARCAGISDHQFFDRQNLYVLMKHLTDVYNLKFDIAANLGEVGNKKIVGFYDSHNSTVKVDLTITNSPRFAFVLAHEIAHFILHKNLDWDQADYDNDEDAFYNAFLDTHQLTNPKQWIEWQANYFASALLMHEHSFKRELILTQKDLGISQARVGYIYLDDQVGNQKDYFSIVSSLSRKFNVTQTSIIYKLKEFGVFKYPSRG